MANVTVQSQVSPELKEQAEALFAELGISIADAIHIFLHQAVNTGGLPFSVTIKRLNAESLEAMNELDRGEGNVFHTTEELFTNWKR